MESNDNAEKLSLNDDYKRAFNEADMVINQFPALLDKLKSPEGKSSEYLRGFQDRLKIHERDQEILKNRTRLSQKLNNSNKGKDKNKDDKDKN